MSWLFWRTSFERRSRRPLPLLAGAAHGLPASWCSLLARSLAIFQLGESKGGRLADQIDHASFRGIDEDYRAAVKLFVAEEQRHGEVLADCVRALGGRLLEDNWTETLFVGLRRRVGVRGKLVVLLAAEVIGLGFYRMVAARLPAGPLRAAIEEICDDEIQHLAFHRAFFDQQLRSPAARAAFAAGWYLLAGGAAAVVAIDHRETLRALAVPWTEVASRFASLIAAQVGASSPAIQGKQNAYIAAIVWGHPLNTATPENLHR